MSGKNLSSYYNEIMNPKAPSAPRPKPPPPNRRSSLRIQERSAPYPISPTKSRSLFNCVVCHEQIDPDQNDGVTINRKDYWHQRCNRCTDCDDVLVRGQRTGTLKRGGVELPLCRRCYKRREDERRCFECERVVHTADRVTVKSIGRLYHISCFKCTSCDAKLDPSNPEASCEQGDPLCPTHRPERKSGISFSGLIPSMPSLKLPDINSLTTFVNASVSPFAPSSSSERDIFSIYDRDIPTPGHRSLSFDELREWMAENPRSAGDRCIEEIIWRKKSEGVKHEYLVLRVGMPSGRKVYMRMDRGADKKKPTMISRVPVGSSVGSFIADDLVQISATMDKLKVDKDKILFKIVFPKSPPKLWCLHNIIQAIEEAAPTYMVLDANCWIISAIIASNLKRYYGGVIAEGQKEFPHQWQGIRVLSRVEAKFKEIQQAEQLNIPFPSPSPRVINLIPN